MCVAYPGKVNKINNDGTAQVDFDGNMVNAMSGLVKIKEGDYVLVHAGCIIQVMDEKEALELSDLFKEMESI